MSAAAKTAGRFSRRGLLAATAASLLSLLRPPSARAVASPAEPLQTQPAGQISWNVDLYPEIAALTGPIGRVLTANATAFNSLQGPVYGFNAGESYPHVFARDTSTFAEFVPFLFDSEYQRTPVEAFLLTQDKFAADDGLRGAVAATLSPSGEGEKATASSDEEMGIIKAASAYFDAAGGPKWLLSKQRGKTIIQRLNDAMDYVLRSRRDAATGLIYRAHTTDWGDVKLEGGPRPTGLLPGDAVTASVFDQALAYQSLRQLQRMNAAVNDDSGAERCARLAVEIRDAANSRLWDDARGRYRIHVHLTPLIHSFDEDSIVSSGNAVAAQTELASDAQTSSIFDRLTEAAQAAGTRRAGLSLWPPYPAGSFNHPNMYPAVYQNGGLWDWWAGVQILAEFERGASQAALDHLRETARHWQSSSRISEWFHLPSGSDQGSPQFAAAAGTMGLAVVRGLFGARLTLGAYQIVSRLGAATGSISVEHRPTGARIGYAQRAGQNWIALDVTAHGVSGGAVSALVPQEWPDALVLVDDAPAGAGLQTKMHDKSTRPVELPQGVHTVAIIRAEPGSPETAWQSPYGRFQQRHDGSGFWITNASGIAFWDGYSNLGGSSLLGPAISGRFILNGLVSQAVQRAVLQWDPVSGKTVIAPVFKLLSRAGKDSWLANTHRIPPPGSPDLGLLERDSAIKSFVLGKPEWQERIGLPVSMAEFPDVIVLRTENAAFQRWKVVTPWGAVPGEVTPVNAGAIALEAGLIPASALTPVPGLPAPK